MIEKIVIGMASIVACTVLIPVFGLVMLGKLLNKVLGD